MTLQELQDAQEKMGEHEQARRYKECRLDRGGCELSALATPASNDILEYCLQCLTLHANGRPQDAPPAESLL